MLHQPRNDSLSSTQYKFQLSIHVLCDTKKKKPFKRYCLINKSLDRGEGIKKAAAAEPEGRKKPDWV